MRNLIAVPVTLLSLATLGLAACAGGSAPEQTPAPAQQEQQLNSVGQGCDSDASCTSGLCWTVWDSYPQYNPYWINADQCTEECGGPDDHATCQQLAADYNAPYPSSARCIPSRGVYDNYPYDDTIYVCDLIPAGLGAVHWVE